MSNSTVIFVNRVLNPAGEISSPVNPTELRKVLAAGMAAKDRRIDVRVTTCNVTFVSTFFPATDPTHRFVRHEVAK